MDERVRIAVASDIHYASAAEQARGDDYEGRIVRNRALRLFVHYYRRFFWARDPLHRSNAPLDTFIRTAQTDHAIICGDLTCDTGFSGLSDPAAYISATECLGKLRQRFTAGLGVVHGDHDLGKKSFFGQAGGMRLESLKRMERDLQCPAFWTRAEGNYILMGVSSSLLAYTAFESEALETERTEWTDVSRRHFDQVSAAFESLPARSKVILFCHDPTALPFLLQSKAVRDRLPQIERTIIGHLHSRLILAKSRVLAGMPHIRFLGHTVSKLSAALRQARLWRPFNVILCPAIAGIELLNDGGYCELTLDPDAKAPARVTTKRLNRE